MGHRVLQLSASAVMNVSPQAIPLDFISTVQPWRSSATSSGSTLVRSHASSHLGFATALPLTLGVLDFFDLSFFLEKRGIASDSCRKSSVRFRG